MAITFECEGCGKIYAVRDELAGQTGQCKQCGHRMIIPLQPDPEDDGLEIMGRQPGPQSGPPPPRAFAPQPAMPHRSSVASPPPSPSRKGFFSPGGNGMGGLIAGLVVVAGIGFRMYTKWERAQARNARNARGNAMGPRNPGPNANPARAFAVDRDGPITLPNFPDPGPGREIEPGITFHEITLGPPRPPFGSTPGHSGKLWLYLPSGEHPARSLPCILIAGAGSNLITGMGLGDGDRPEHLPYVRAGFAVLAFELDGALEDRRNVNEKDLGESMFRFLNARAGLVNAHIALEYAFAKVPQVDPSRISAAGHSSAGTLAVLFAEHEPRLKACVAFAPALDLEKRFGPRAVAQLRRAGAGDLAVRYSPGNGVDKLNVPLFLFHAKDDSNVPVEESEAFAGRLKAKGKPVSLDIVPSGNHYDSMINEGIPHAIAWLDEHGAGPGR